MTAEKPNFRYYRSDGGNIAITKLRGLEGVDDFTAFAEYLRGNVSRITSTREEFFAADKVRQNNLKKAQPYYVPSVPRDKAIRSEDWVARSNLLFLDIDKPDVAEMVLAWIAFLGAPVLPWPYIVHHTARSTPAEPRLRVIVSAEGIPPSNYPQAISTVARALNLETITAESYDNDRAFYFPAVFAGETAESHSPFVDVQVDGHSFGLGDLDQEDLLSTDSGTHTKVKPETAEDDWDAYVQKPRVDGWTLEDAEELLKLFPSDSYEEWLGVGMALKHQFGDDGFALYDRWSSTATAKGKYEGTQATREKWDKGFKEHATKKGRSRTWATYLHKAKTEKGWEPAKQVRRQMDRVIAWMSDRARTPEELRDRGTEKIAKIVALSKSQREELLDKLCELRKKENVGVPIRVLREELREKIHKRRDDKPDDLPAWARSFCYVGGTVNEFYHTVTGHVSIPETFNNTYTREMPAGSEHSPKDYVLHACKMRVVHNYAYNPTEGLFFDDKRQGLCVNLYRATYPERDDENAPEAKRLLKRHLENLIGEPEYRRVLMDWLAYQAQYPGKKVHWVPLIQGGQGCGKGTIGEIVKDVLGESNVRFIDSSSLEPDFNEWASGSQVVVLSEIHNVGDRRHKVVNRLKMVVADSVIDHDVKNSRPKQVTNVTNYIAFTNHHNAVPLEVSDRRYFVIKSPLQTAAQVATVTPQIHELHAFRESFPGAFRAVLLDWKISDDFKPKGHAPETTYKDEMRNASRSPLQHAISEALADSNRPELREDMFTFAALTEAVAADEGSLKSSRRHFQDALTELGYVPKGRPTVNGVKQSIWVKRGSLLENASTEEVRLEFTGRLDNAGVGPDLNDLL